MVGDTLENKPLHQSIELWKDLFFRLMFKRLEIKSSSVFLPLTLTSVIDIIFEKLAPQMGDCI